MKLHRVHRFTAYIVLSVVLSSCSLLNSTNEAQTPQTNDQDLIEINFSIEEIKNWSHPIALVNDNRILLANSAEKKVYPVYLMQGDEIPPIFRIFDIKVSFQNDYLVWYSPYKGLLSLKLGESEAKVIKQPNQWLSNNPYFEFDPGKNILYLVDDEGLGFYSINLDTSESKKIEIPFPFGNAFQLSPDMRHVLFVSAFGQNDEVSEYMITDIEGANPVRFTTSTPLNLRQKVAWLPDSSGVLMLGDQANLVMVATGSVQEEVFYAHPNQEVTLTEFNRLDNLLYYATSEGWWHVVDVDTKEEVARIPRQIAEDVHRPRFLPWYDNSFLIEETLRLDPEQFKRLWRSSFIGVKDIIVDEFDQTTITTDTPQI